MSALVTGRPALTASSIVITILADLPQHMGPSDWRPEDH
jgi:hypothetical protein